MMDAINARKAWADTSYSGVNITSALGSFQSSFSFTEVAGGGSDSVSITVIDRDGLWISSWFPTNKDHISASIHVQDWYAPGDGYALNCGEFTIDDVSASGAPTKLSIGAVSAPADTGFSETKREKTWEGVSLQQVAQEIAGNSGISLEYYGSEIPIKSLEQSDTDSAFLKKLCEDYGYSMKIYSGKLVIFDREEFKKKGAVCTISKAEMKSWSYNETLAGTYTGVKFSYTDPFSGNDIVYEAGTDERLLTESGKADSWADAELKAKAALNNKNHGSTSMTVQLMGMPGISAGVNVQISGIGKPDGKYYVDEVTHNVTGSGYTTSLKLSKCE